MWAHGSPHCVLPYSHAGGVLNDFHASMVNDM